MITRRSLLKASAALPVAAMLPFMLKPRSLGKSEAVVEMVAPRAWTIWDEIFYTQWWHETTNGIVHDDLGAQHTVERL